MKSKTLSFSTHIINKLVIVLFTLMLPLGATYAASSSSCCSHHGGVTGCNATTGYQQCKDGSASPSCTCPKSKKATETKKTTKTPASKTTGCCSSHGGVAQCNKTKGLQTCKDGTTSTTCKCN